MKTLISLVFGFSFGSILILSQAISWFRIQEMFHFKSFHMFGVLFSAILTGIISIQLIKRFKVKSINGKIISVSQKPMNLKGNIIGGVFFGAGWALTGACTAPLFIMLGMNWSTGLITLVGAVVGVLIYGLVANKIK